jgi:hypothetical protein
MLALALSIAPYPRAMAMFSTQNILAESTPALSIGATIGLTFS